MYTMLELKRDIAELEGIKKTALDNDMSVKQYAEVCKDLKSLKQEEKRRIENNETI